jgi:hypothetical protein
VLVAALEPPALIELMTLLRPARSLSDVPFSDVTVKFVVGVIAGKPILPGQGRHAGGGPNVPGVLFTAPHGS